MTEMPKEIYACINKIGGYIYTGHPPAYIPDGLTKYIRADLVPQWQPIETAPKDGTEILIRYANGCVEKVRWCHEWDCWQQTCDETLKVTTRNAVLWMNIPPAEGE